MKLEEPVRRLLEQMRALQAFQVNAETVPAARAQLAALAQPDGPMAEGVAVRDIDVGGITVRTYRPTGAGPWPLHLYAHGADFLFGSALSGAQDGELSRRALEAGCLVASVEYRLAPEHPFPAGLEDCYSALTGLLARADELAIDPGRVTVGGASSGGNFAAALALMARDRGGPAIALQLLEIAGTDLTKSSHAWRHPAPGHDTTRERDLALVDLYLGSLAARAHPYASPLFAPDLAGLAPAYVMSAEHDPRRDECEAYVARLTDAATPARARTMAGHVHGSMTLTGWEGAEQWRHEANEVLAAVNEGRSSPF
ncbi:MAG: alpha/beta hydrolase [Bifidobacteriaceae bacterium]|nr:alpha/beta hydrolase [Bifidobacteriaceae bacterium]